MSQLVRKIPLRRAQVPVVRQMEEADCGAACLSTVLRHFGKWVSLDEVRDVTGTGRDGVSALSLVQAARAYGLNARGVRADVTDLQQLPAGTVLHWDLSHFVVLRRATRNGAHIVDPARGRVFVTSAKLRRSYTGVALMFSPGSDFTPGRGPATGNWRYLRTILGQSRSITRIITTSVILRVVALTLPLLTALVVDQVVPHDDRQLLTVFAVGAGAVLGYQLLATLLRANLLLELRVRLELSLTTGFVDHMVDLPYSFFLRRSAGDLMMRMQSNSAVRDILTSSTLSAFLDGAFASFYLVMLFIVSPALGWLVLGLAALHITCLAVRWRRGQRLMSESLQAQAEQQSSAYELLSGIQTLKACGAEHRAVERWKNLYASQINIELTRGRLTSAVNSVISMLNVGAPLFILLVGGFQVLAGNFSVGTMLSASALASGFLGPLATLVGTALQLQLITSYMERINDVLGKPKEQEGQELPAAPPLTGRISARQVSFRYSPLAPDVVRNVTLEIQPGHRIGIAGRSGSGKSTLAHLLLGMYQPVAGRIEFDGRDLAGLDIRSVRRQVGIVTQHPYVFGSSIRENIALADPGLPMQAVIEAAKLACIHDDIVAMPMGYDTRLHDGGASLSGGQRQRIALARALVTRPSVLLLDEATSDLDTVTEQQIYENLTSITATTIVIAHRLSTLRNSDLIVVMESGAIAEAGTHDELLGRGGRYWLLATAQAGITEQDRPLPAMTPNSGKPAVPSPARGENRL